jgi:hypothetical protein
MRTGLGNIEADVVEVGAFGLGEQQVGVGGARHLEQELRIVGAGCVVFAASGGLAVPVALHACGREPRFSMHGLPSCSAHHRHSSLHSFRLRSIAVARIMFSPPLCSLHSIRRSMLGPFHKFLHDCCSVFISSAVSSPRCVSV